MWSYCANTQELASWIWLERSFIVLYIPAERRKLKRYSLNPKQVLYQVEAQLTNSCHSGQITERYKRNMKTTLLPPLLHRLLKSFWYSMARRSLGSHETPRLSRQNCETSPGTLPNLHKCSKIWLRLYWMREMNITSWSLRWPAWVGFWVFLDEIH